MFPHEYDQILSFFKNHPGSISVEKIRHIIFGEIKKNGMHTGGHFDFGAHALRNNGNLLNYVKTKAKGVLEVEMLLAKGTKISKHYFSNDSYPVEFFEKIAEHLHSPEALVTLKNLPPTGDRFLFTFNNIATYFIINGKKEIISSFPIV